MTLHPRVRRLPCRDIALLAAAVVVGVVAACLIARIGLFPYAPNMARPNGNSYDFGILYRSTVAMWSSGGEMYPRAAPNFSPPATMIVLGPLAALSATTAYRLFVLLSVVALVASLLWVSGVERPKPNWLGSGMIAATLISPAAGVTLSQGQVYAFLALGLAAAWALDQQDRHLSAGVALGLVVAFKPILAAILLWPLIRGRGPEFRAALATTVAVTVLGVLVARPSETLRYIGVLRAGYPQGDIDNASLTNTGIRLFTVGRSIPPLANLPVMAWVVGLVAVALLAVSLIRGTNHELGLWTIVAGSLLASPLAWRGYFLLLVPAVLILLSRRRTRYVGALLAALLLIPHQVAGLVGPGTPYILATLIGPLILLALWVGCYVGSTSADDSDRKTEPAFTTGPAK